MKCNNTFKNRFVSYKIYFREEKGSFSRDVNWLARDREEVELDYPEPAEEVGVHLRELDVEDVCHRPQHLVERDQNTRERPADHLQDHHPEH